jgi:hypothetical protein
MDRALIAREKSIASREMHRLQDAADDAGLALVSAWNEVYLASGNSPQLLEVKQRLLAHLPGWLSSSTEGDNTTEQERQETLARNQAELERITLVCAQERAKTAARHGAATQIQGAWRSFVKRVRGDAQWMAEMDRQGALAQLIKREAAMSAALANAAAKKAREQANKLGLDGIRPHRHLLPHGGKSVKFTRVEAHIVLRDACLSFDEQAAWRLLLSTDKAKADQTYQYTFPNGSVDVLATAEEAHGMLIQGDGPEDERDLARWTAMLYPNQLETTFI